MAYRTERPSFVLLLCIFIFGSKGNLIADGDENWAEKVGNPGLSGLVGVAQHQADLYAFGSFNSVGGVAATNIARSNAGAWSPVGGGMVGERSHVGAVASDGQNLYAGGLFSTAGGVPARNIARWDGTNWSPLGEGVNGTIRCIAVSGSNVFVGGLFTMAGGISASRVARWDGASWSGLEGGSSLFT